MTAHQAHAIESRTDRDLLEFFINETIRQYPFMTRDSAESTVVGRALRIVEQSNAISMNTLMALEEIVRSLAELPGRKVVFFVSDGFVLNLRGSNASNRLQRIADAAARSRVVIYTMDGRGLVSQPDFDASRPAVSDATGAVSRSNADEINSSQAPLYRLAADSGGRALINSNALVDIVPQALQETSRYYLLGWTPRQQEDQEERQNNRFHRIEVSVRGRPELTVRVPRGFYGTQPPADEAAPASSRRRRQSATPATPAASEAEAALISTLRSRHPVTTLPMTLSLRFFDMPATGAVLTGTAHLNATTLDFGASDGNAGQAVVDVISAVFNDQGQSVSDVKERLTISPPSSSTTPRATSGRVTYSHQFQLKPGLYQVRVAARDTTTGRAGSAMEWIEIPDLSSGPFTMSSLILGEIAPGTSQNETDAASIPPMEVNANHHFRRAPRLRLLAYLYNVSRSAAPPDVALRIQVFRDDRPVIASPLSPLRTEGIADLSRIPYFAELNMEGMPSGGYVLQVMAIDRATNSTTSQQASFDIE
jgi:hypothetical protein